MSLLEDKLHPELFYSAPSDQVCQLDYVLLPYTMPSTGVLAVEADRDHVKRHQKALLAVLHSSALAGSEAARGPAMVAAAGLGDSEKVSELLMEPEISVDTQDNSGITALWSAARQNHTEVVEMLLIAKASHDLAAASGLAPMHCAAQQGHQAVVEMLLSYSSNVDQTDKQFFTPLLWAVQNNYVEVVKLLLNAGAQELETAKSTAQELDFTEIADLIDESEAKLRSDGAAMTREMTMADRKTQRKTIDVAVSRARRQMSQSLLTRSFR